MARGDLNVSQTGSNTRGSAGDKSLETTVLRVINSKLGLSQTDVQDLQTLAGLRGRALDGSFPNQAVTRKDVSTIGKMAPMKSSQVTAAPTAADFNALQADVNTIYQALAAIALAFA